MKNKLFGLSMSVLLTTSILLLSPKTNAKFFVENFGVAWENYFTEFTQLKDVFFVTNDNTSTGTFSKDKLWGTHDTDANSLFGNNTELQDNDGIYAYGTSGTTGFSSTKRVTVNDVKSTFSEYLVEKLKGIEINVVNQSSNPVIVTFEIHYYGPKLDNSTDTHFTFELYNTIEHPNGKEETIDGVVRNYALQGEFLVNLGSEAYSKGKASYVDIPVVRNSGNSGGEYKIWLGDYYYPHRADINPYHMLFDDKTGNKYQPHYEYYNGSTRYYSAYTSGSWNTGTSMVYRYPSWDNTNSKSATEILKYVNINDFILEPSEPGSFNLSLYYGEAGNNDSGTGSFVTSLCLNVETLDKAKSDYNALVTLHNNNYIVS